MLHELGRNLGDALGMSFRPAILDRDGATLDPAEFTQSLHKGGGPLNKRRSAIAQKPDGRQLARLLRPRGQRARDCCTAKKCKEFAPSHEVSPRPKLVKSV